MQIGVIGLGRMGGNIVRRLTRAGHSCVVYDGDPAAIELTSHRLITIQIGTPLTEIPNFTWTGN